MSTINKKEISDALKTALNREELHSREAAKFLNLNPCYISMAQNPNSWDAMGKTAWLRLEAWLDTREAISVFQIPYGEEVWQPKERPAKIEAKAKSKKTEKIWHKAPGPAESTSELTISLAYYEEQRKKVNAELCRLTEENEKLKDIINRSPVEKELTSLPIATQKLALDIEINLLINGQKIRL
jgi:hypothetical protein